MAAASTASPAPHQAVDLSTGALGTQHIKTFGRHFIDGYGRILQLRGFNISGASKLPTRPNGLSHLSEGFFDHENVSFVGRPFPLEEAPFHLSRLRAWGHTLVRLLVTWEALGHRGPDPAIDIDDDYVAYLEALLTMMGQYGLRVVICAHQDVWSRFSGGSGAPGWTFEKAGLDVEAFKATGAAYVHNLSGQDASEPGHRQRAKREPVGAFVWPSGYEKLAAATMATLFWAGETFAWQLDLPHFDAKERAAGATLNIQHYLQQSFMECFGALIDRIGNLDAVIGVDLINEPHRGYVGLYDWHMWCYETDLHIGHFPSALQGLAMGSGYRQEVPFYVKSWPWPTRKSHMSMIDPLGKSAWLPDHGMKQCIWRAHGAWQWDEKRKQPVVLIDDFFSRDPRPGKDKRRVEWYRDCYAPFVARFTERIRQKHRHLLCFVEPIPNEFMPPWSSQQVIDTLDEHKRLLLMKSSYDQSYATKTFIDTKRPRDLVYAPHFYDLNVLFGKKHGAMSVNVQALSRGEVIYKALFFGIEGLKKNYGKQIGKLVQNGKTSLGSVPTVIGEVGIPFDINGAHALRTGDYGKHIELFDALIEAMELHQVAFTLWNYNPDNAVEHGDGWNEEDFSVVCNDTRALDIHNDIAEELQAEEKVKGAARSSNLEALYHGGRALTAIIRPYAVKVAGYPLRSSWDRDKRIFEFTYANPPSGFRESALQSAETINVRLSGDAGGKTPPVERIAIDAPHLSLLDSTEARATCIYIPRYHFDELSVHIDVKDGTYLLDREKQTLTVYHEDNTPGYVHTVRVIGRDIAYDRREQVPESRALLARRARNARRRRGRIPLTAQDVCALLGVVLCFFLALALTYGVSTLMSDAADGDGLRLAKGTVKSHAQRSGRGRQTEL